jgi:hypothetical protein
MNRTHPGTLQFWNRLLIFARETKGRAKLKAQSEVCWTLLDEFSEVLDFAKAHDFCPPDGPSPLCFRSLRIEWMIKKRQKTARAAAFTIPWMCTDSGIIEARV